MKKFVDDGMFLQMKITLVICQKKNYFYYKKQMVSGSDTPPLRKRSDFKQSLSTLERLHQDGGEQFAPHSLLEEQTMEVGIEFVLYMVGMARLLVVFLGFGESWEWASKVLGKKGVTRC